MTARPASNTSFVMNGEAGTTVLESPPAAKPAVCKPEHPAAANRVLRICHVSMTLQTGGLERLLVDFGRFCDRSRFRLYFVALGELGQPAKELADQGWVVHSLAAAGGSRSERLRTLARLFRQWQIDLVHSHNTFAHFYAALAARWAGVVGVINTQHGRGCGQGWKARVQFVLANRFCQRVVGVSHDAARLCRRQDPLSASKTVTVWNGIDVDRFAFRGPQLHNTAISVGRLSPEKDFPTLLRALPYVVAQVPDFQLRVVGGGPEERRLRRLADELGQGRRVQFLGERSDVPVLLAHAGLFVSSSQTEGIALTLLEAMAVGLPVVATKVGGNPEVVVDGVTGRLVAAGDAQALAQAVVDLCRRQSLRLQMARQARRRVEQYFDIRKTVAQYERLYEQVVRKGGDLRLRSTAELS